MTVPFRSLLDPAPPRAAEGPAGAASDDPAAETGPLWRRIHAILAAEIAEGRWAPGQRLPSETALARRFGVNRHTLRRAVALLSEEGAVHVRRGAGAVVTQTVADYPIGPRTRFTENLRRAGLEPSRQFLAMETAGARRAEAEALGLAPGAQVHCAESLSCADGVPVAFSRAVWPATLEGLLEALEREGSVTAALAECGVPDYRRAWTRLTAQRPGALLARHLRIPDTMPLLRAEALSLDPAGRPVEYALSWFCTDRMPMTVESDGLPRQERAPLPSRNEEGITGTGRDRRR